MNESAIKFCRDCDLPSPSFVVDLGRASRNCSRMLAAARAQRIGVRPHVKTHKSREGAALQVGEAARDDSRCVVVSTLCEAEFLGLESGGKVQAFGDVLYGVLLEPSKFARAWRLHCALPSFSVLVDSAETAVALADFAAAQLSKFADAERASDEFMQAARRVSVFLAVDAAGYGREGVPALPDAGGADAADDLASAPAVSVAREIDSSRRLRLAGIYSHSGNSYNACTDASCAPGAAAAVARSGAGACGRHEDARAAAARVAARELGAMKGLAQTLKSFGIAVPVISVGATPSACSGFEWRAAAEVEELEGAGPRASATQLEVHPGNYIFFDRQQIDSGSCTADDVACYVLARVIARYPERNEILIDAGGCALHKDPAGLKDGTWGCLLEDPTLVLKKLTQEVAVVGRLGPSAAQIDLTHFPPGRVVRVVPNHSCMTAACHARYFVVDGPPADDGSRAIVDEWVPCKFW